MRIRLKLGCQTSLLLFASCGTDVGNPVIDMDFTLYDSEEFAGAAKSRFAIAPPGLSVDKAWVVVERIRLRDATNCEGGDQDEFVGPFAVDMLARGADPGLSNLEVTATSYCRVEVRWDALQAGEIDGVPAELVGASLLLEGKRADGTRFVLRSERGDELRLDARDSAFTIDDLTNALFVSFDVQDLFDGVDIDAAEVVDGTIRIEDGSNEDLLATFNDNLVDGAKLFDDNDGDGELDPEERDDTDILGD